MSEIGQLDGGENEDFAWLVDAHFLDDGVLALLDRQNAAVTLFDVNGTHLQTIGGVGDGPGEFQVPLKLIRPEAGVLAVLDARQFLHRFELRDGGFEFRERAALESVPNDICVSEDAVILHTPSHGLANGEDALLYRFEEEQGLHDGFASAYRYDERLVAERMRRGRIVCGQDGVSLLVYEFMNRVDAYDTSSGTLLWHGTFDGIHMPPLEARTRSDGRRAVAVDYRREPQSHGLLGAVGGAGAPVLIQFMRLDREDVIEGIDRFDVETYQVDPETGRGVYLGDDIPQILALTGDRVVLLHQELYPRVEVAELPVD